MHACIFDSKAHYNIASWAAQSNSVYVSVLQISIVHSDCASKSLCQNFFSRERPLLAWGKIFRYFATIMDWNRDSSHQSQNEDNFRPFLLARVLKWGRKREKQRKRRLGIGAITIRFTVRGWNAILAERHSGKTKQVTNWSVSSFKGKLKFFRFKIVKYLHFHLQPQYKYELFHINFTSFHCTGRYELNKLTSLPMCGFIAQMVEHRTGIRGGHGFESCWSPDFFRLLLSNCLNWKIYCDDHSSRSCYKTIGSCF